MPKKTAKLPPAREKLEVVYRPISTITLDPNNARRHSKEQIAQLRASFKQFGFTSPILLRPSGMIGAGHGRFEMAKLEGLTEVPTITLNLTEKQWRAYAIADNQIPLAATWDMDVLRAEVKALEGEGLDLAGLGIDALTLDPQPELEVPAGTRVNQSIVQFNIVFDDETQQAAWFAFVRKLKGEYPKLDTLGARLAKFLETVKL